MSLRKTPYTGTGKGVFGQNNGKKEEVLVYSGTVI
jgi:hypothetical protein